MLSYFSLCIKAHYIPWEKKKDMCREAAVDSNDHLSCLGEREPYSTTGGSHSFGKNDQTLAM